MSALRRMAGWCAGHGLAVSGWLGFMLAAALVGGLGAVCALAGLSLAGLAGPSWYGLGALVVALAGLALLWLLSVLLRLHGAPWRAMLLVVALECWYCWHWLHQPFNILR